MADTCRAVIRISSNVFLITLKILQEYNIFG
jgi:hypothetical protein